MRTLAALRLEEAGILLANGKLNGAFYLAGCSVELALKAKIAERLGISSLFAEQPLPSDQFADIGKLRQLVQTHKLPLLWVISGLWPAYLEWKANDPDFGRFCITLENWSEQLRYKPAGTIAETEVRKFIDFLTAPNGFLTWIENK